MRGHHPSGEDEAYQNLLWLTHCWKHLEPRYRTLKTLARVGLGMPAAAGPWRRRGMSEHMGLTPRRKNSEPRRWRPKTKAPCRPASGNPCSL